MMQAAVSSRNFALPCRVALPHALRASAYTRSLAGHARKRVATRRAIKATSTAEALPPASRTADTKLGELFLRLLPRHLYYGLALVYPLVTAVAGVGAVWAPAIVQFISALPLVQALGPVSPLLHHLATTQPAATLLSVVVSLLTAYLAFFLMPLGDYVLGRDLRNPSAEEAVAVAQDRLYKSVLYAYCPLHIFVLCGLCHVLSTTATHPLAFAGATISAGVSGGILFTAAHELLHGSHPLDKLGANALLAAVGYMHWCESHLAHHVKVATPEDPASARRGESLYAFIPRSIWGNIVDGYGIEAKRLRRRGIPLLSLKNKMLAWVLSPAALAAGAYLVWGWRGLAFAVGQAVVSILMLETVNYVEHYGLVREKDADGRYEKVGLQHSWNAAWMMTSSFAFRLQRHADHHLWGNRPYQLLRDIPEAPQLPYSYPGAMMVALLPPLHFKIMDARIDAYQATRRQQQHLAVAE